MEFIFSKRELIDNLRGQGHGEDAIARMINGFNELARQGLILLSRSGNSIGITQEGLRRMKPPSS